MDEYKKHVLSCLTFDKDNDKPSIDFIPIIREHQLFSGNNLPSLENVVKSINQYLGASKTRKYGLALLKELVEQCCTEVFLRHVRTWINLLIQILQSHDSVVLYQTTSHILSVILETISSFPELSRDAANSVVPKLFPLLLDATVEWRQAALTCMGICIKNFPGASGVFKSKLESLIWKELSENTSQQNVISCLVLLPRCGSGGSHGVKFSVGWTELCNKLLLELKMTLLLLYEGLEMDSGLNKTEKISIICPDLEPERGRYLTKHFQILSHCLEALLSEPFPAVVGVPLENILQTVSHCLAVNKNILLSRPTTTKIWLLARLPFLQNSVLSVLASLIQSVRQKLLPHCEVVNKLFLQTLFSTHWDSCTYRQDYPLMSVRKSTYSGLLLWLQVLGYGTNLINDGNDLVKEILHDVVPVTDVRKLDGAPAKKPHKGGGYEDLDRGIGLQKKINPVANCEITVIALKVLTLLVDIFGQFWKQKTQKDIVENIISTVISVQQSSTLPVPFESTSCRLVLYQTLLSCTLTVHPNIPSPVHISTSLFRQALQDDSIEVFVFCKRAISICECVIHPRGPSLHGPSLTECSISVERPYSDDKKHDDISLQNDSFDKRHARITELGENKDDNVQNSPHSSGNSKIIYLKTLQDVSVQTENEETENAGHVEETEDGCEIEMCRNLEMEEQTVDGDICNSEKNNLAECDIFNKESVDVLEERPQELHSDKHNGMGSEEDFRHNPAEDVKTAGGRDLSASTQSSAEIETMLLSFVDADPDSDN